MPTMIMRLRASLFIVLALGVAPRSKCCEQPITLIILPRPGRFCNGDATPAILFGIDRYAKIEPLSPLSVGVRQSLQRFVDEADSCAHDDPLNEVGDGLVDGQLESDVQVDVVMDREGADREEADECAEADA